MAATAWSCALLVLAVTVPFVAREPAPAGGSIGSGTSATQSAGAVSAHVTLAQADCYRVLVLAVVPTGVLLLAAAL
jgi:hypothetical protein